MRRGGGLNRTPNIFFSSPVGAHPHLILHGRDHVSDTPGRTPDACCRVPVVTGRCFGNTDARENVACPPGLTPRTGAQAPKLTRGKDPNPALVAGRCCKKARGGAGAVVAGSERDDDVPEDVDPAVGGRTEEGEDGELNVDIEEEAPVAGEVEQ